MHTSYIKFISVFSIIAFLAGGMIAFPSLQAKANIDPMNTAQLELSMKMRELMAQHVIFTREYIVAFAGNLPETQNVANRLLKNQEDIGNAVKPYYGEERGNRLTELLKTHITTAVDLLNAEKSGNMRMRNDAERRWRENGQQIAMFLEEINSNWSKQMVLDMWNDHLTFTAQEAQAQLNGRFEESIMTFDRVFMQSMSMADAFTEGIIKQFPDKF